MTRYIILLVNLYILSSTTDASSSSSIAAAGASSKGSISSAFSESSSYSNSSGHSDSSNAPASCCSGRKKKASCPKNEVRSKCVQALCRAQNCTQKGKAIACPAVAKRSCKKGCVCARGFLRDSSGKCIPENKCPVVCQADEEFSNCTQAVCRHVNCSQRGSPVVCPAIAEGSCKSGCVCQAGLLRTATGACVPEKQCYGDLVCDDSEVVNSCPKKCINDYCPKCEDDDGGCSSDEADQDESESCGEPVCNCRFNFKRSSETGSCIPTRECPPFDCSSRPYEEYNSCPPICPSDSCSQATPTGRCPIFGRIGIVLQCKPACRCIKGYWRNNGTCVPYAACPGKCPTNEKYSSCIQAECRALNCTQKDQPIACPRVAEGSCRKGCVCVEGTLRVDNGSCIPEDKCPAGKCPTNEKYSSCIQAECRALNCTQKDQPIACPRIAEGSCRKGCVCVEGTLRVDNGSCIPEDKCPVVCPTNMEYSNCTQAICRQLTCSQKEERLSCPAVAEGSCQSGCVCKTGYLRTANDTCVPENQCNGDLVCEDNEIVLNCPNTGFGDYCPKNEEDAKLTSKEFSDPCEGPTCTCRFNYMRDDNGTCIPTRDCPPFNCSGENEEYNACPPYCPTDDCSQATPSGRCPLPGRIGIVLQCRPNCRCIRGYWRNNGVCVPYDKCPGKCPRNEEFSICKQGVCRAQNCTQKGRPVPCPEIAEGSCETGCVCVEGTLRGINGKCVPEDQCPAPTCGETEFYSECSNGCDPVNCPKSFKEEQERLADCVAPAVCLPPDCRCLRNFRRDENGKCIYIGKCPGICPAYEEFSNCTQALCRAQNCSQLGQSIACSAVKEGSCQSGCVCEEGTLRDMNGNCVPEGQCKGKCLGTSLGILCQPASLCRLAQNGSGGTQ